MFSAQLPMWKLMSSMRISQTIYLLLGLALLAGGCASTYLLIRCAGVSASYTAISVADKKLKLLWPNGASP